MKFQQLIDWDFIAISEGGRILKGYVPHLDGGEIESGVTIATGFDLGQRGINDVPERLVNMLMPYLGVTGEAAVELAKTKPLVISQSVAKEIDEFSHNEAVELFLMDWNNSQAEIKFECLHINIRTAILDVAFQYGDLPSRTPNFWSQVTRGQWLAAYNNLLNFGDSYRSRRHREANLLKEVMLWT